ncbi:MAG: DNA repair protein RadA [Dehalococcoidia bacterium]|nr:DNA repair protein RadA [Dehalococcoidia bacterium]
MTADNRGGARLKQVFICRQCGRESAKWLGQCPSCESWNSFETVTVDRRSSRSSSVVGARPEALASVSLDSSPRMSLGVTEFDRVLGGGLVPGSLVLLGGEPGIGKSTLLLQVCSQVARDHGTVVYVSGEESPQQVRLRAERLRVSGERILLLAETDLDAILQHLEAAAPMLVVVDSIQTMSLDGVTGAPGSLSQVRECTLALMRFAKQRTVSVLLAGHVTKEGAIAGPGTLEHIVDVVLYMEGERHSAYRLVRGVKNRFGSTDELGVFEMVAHGLVEVENASLVFTGGKGHAIGSVIVPVLEGSRPLLVEIQALTTPAGFGPPRRVANGFDVNRLLLIAAVLTKRARMRLSDQDVIVNVTGGLRIAEPAADLGVALAIVSSLRDRAITPGLVVFGELGLGGEVRGVSQPVRRLGEAGRLGFSGCVLPAESKLGAADGQGLQLLKVSSLSQAVARAFERDGGPSGEPAD